MRSAYQSPCEPCKYNYTSVDEFGECEKDVCNCPKDKMKEECWIEQWVREIIDEEKNMSGVTKFVKPINITDEFGDSVLSCPQCKEPIRFPLIRNPWHINDERPRYCMFCGVEFDWEEQK